MAVRYRHSIMQQYKLTFGWLVRCGRECDGLSQQGLCLILKNHYSILLSPQEIDDIEKDCSQLAQDSSLVESLCELFEIHRDWVQQIRQQTEIKANASL
ncbi:hypothetical protein QUB68_24390 [Microcoleus sp. A006_D1]|uniref:hypothetical protein n=1 Tax=Microcoleus sp. A006_D1 TaxID=3055267 RepID=UPI002FD45F8B